MNIVDRTFEQILRDIGSNGLEEYPEIHGLDEEDNDIG